MGRIKGWKRLVNELNNVVDEFFQGDVAIFRLIRIKTQKEGKKVYHVVVEQLKEFPSNFKMIYSVVETSKDDAYVTAKKLRRKISKNYKQIISNGLRSVV